MIDRIDLLIAVIGIVVSIVGSSTALWMAVSKKPDKEDVARLETKLGAVEARLDAKIERVESGLGASMSRTEAKLDAVIMRLMPEPLPRPES